MGPARERSKLDLLLGNRPGSSWSIVFRFGHPAVGKMLINLKDSEIYNDVGRA